MHQPTYLDVTSKHWNKRQVVSSSPKSLDLSLCLFLCKSAANQSDYIFTISNISSFSFKIFEVSIKSIPWKSISTIFAFWVRYFKRLTISSFSWIYRWWPSRHWRWQQKTLEIATVYIRVPTNISSSLAFDLSLKHETIYTFLQLESVHLKRQIPNMILLAYCRTYENLERTDNFENVLIIFSRKS